MLARMPLKPMLNLVVARFKTVIVEWGPKAPPDVREHAAALLAALIRWRDSLP